MRKRMTYPDATASVKHKYLNEAPEKHGVNEFTPGTVPGSEESPQKIHKKRVISWT
jgi:hypothetical protein